MSNKEILEKAIQKAIDGGFKWSMIWPGMPKDYRREIHDGDSTIAFYAYGMSPNPWYMDYATIIFNHDFAQTIWGNREIERIERPEAGVIKTYYKGKDWKQHLQQMVIADDPIKYLGENIE